MKSSSVLWNLSVVRKTDELTLMARYETSAFKMGSSTAVGPLEFEMERKAILDDYERLLPAVMTSSIRFRSLLEDMVSDTAEALENLGKRIFTSLPLEMRGVFDQPINLHLVTNEIKIPWELMHDGKNFLCLEHPLGISPMGKRRFPDMDTKIKDKTRVLFITDTKDDLPETREETEKIASILDGYDKVEHMILMSKDATYSNVRSLLLHQHFDIIHFATHAKFNDTAAEESGIVLHDGILKARELYNTLAPEPPWLVFMNSCESGKSKDLTYMEKHGELTGMALAFCGAGTSIYIGTTCLVNDTSASQIAINFYRHLMNHTGVGESLRKAKLEFRDKYREDYSWCSFVLYGDPTLKIEVQAEEPRKKLDLEEQVRDYMKRTKNFTISQCAKDLGVPMSEIKRILAHIVRN